MNQEEVAGRLIDNPDTQLDSEVVGLIEHGIGKAWGYHLAQVILAVRASRRMGD